VAQFPLEKYSSTEKLRFAIRVIPQLQVEDPEELKLEDLIRWLVQGPLFQALDVTISVMSQGFLTLLFLAFFLVSDVSSFESSFELKGFSHEIRSTVRRYMRIKTMMALAVSTSCGLFYWYMKVDLLFVFCFASFILCYIPTIGNTIAVILPLPLVLLDPTKHWGDLILVFAAPFTVHQLATNLVEPKLLGSSLGLHPIVVLVCLAFWTTVWGAVGAILSVPLTAVFRLALERIDHPYSNPWVKVLRGGLPDFAWQGNSPTSESGHSTLNQAATAQPWSHWQPDRVLTKDTELQSSQGMMEAKQCTAERPPKTRGLLPRTPGEQGDVRAAGSETDLIDNRGVVDI